MIKIWDFFNKTLIANISSDNSSGLAGFITINNRYLIIGSRGNGSLKVFDIQKRIIIKSFDTLFNLLFIIYALLLHIFILISAGKLIVQVVNCRLCFQPSRNK